MKPDLLITQLISIYNIDITRMNKSYFGENNPNWKNARPLCDLCKIRVNSYAKGTKYHRDCYFKLRKQTGQSEEFKKKISLKLKGKRLGEKNSQWKGGIIISPRGYRYIRNPNHPYALANGYIAEHRLVLEKKLGRYLQPDEIVHHINHRKNDNNPENLMLLSTQNEHRSIHAKGNKIWMGRKHSDQTKKKMSLIRTQYWLKKKGLN